MMDIPHLLFYLGLGGGSQLVTPSLPIVGPLAVSAGWHQVRNDLHNPSENRQETQAAQAGGAIMRALMEAKQMDRRPQGMFK